MKLRQSNISELPIIWEILKQAINQRKQDGSEQWQNGYPNELIIHQDITQGYAYVLEDNHVIIAYAAIIFDVEPAYNTIQGQWLSLGDYAVVHRVATAEAVKRKGIATQLFQKIESLCIQRQRYSIKVDTNFDNIPMIKILDKLAYTYCGEVFYDGSPRRAYEKILIEPCFDSVK